MKALLIIDMQQGSFIPYSLRHDTIGTIDRINTLAARFREQNFPVIFIQHDGTKENCFLPGSSDWQLLPELHVAASDYLVSKTVNDCFYKSELSKLLEQHQITSLFITGCATDFCVDTTVKSALSKDYQVTVIADAHTTADRPVGPAAKVIEHYNWLWADMTPTKYPLEVKSAAETEV